MVDNNFLDLEEPQGSDAKKDELILGRFKTPEELATAYKELEGEFTRKSQALSATEKQLLESQARVPAPKVEPEPAEDLNDLFFQEPAKAVERIVAKALDPLVTSNYAREKEAYRGDATFANHEAEIDAIVSQMPHLKTQPGIVSNLYKMVKGLHFDEAEYEKSVREKILTEQQHKKAGALESGDPPSMAPAGEPVKLTEDEKRVARKFNPQLSAEEAYKKYAEKKSKYGGGAQ